MQIFQTVLKHLIVLLFAIAVLNAIVLVRLADRAAQTAEPPIVPHIIGAVVGEVTMTVMVCGDNIVHGTEQCDGNDTNSSTCSSLGYSGGTLGCFGNCTYNTTACTVFPTVRFINASSASGFLQSTAVGISANVSDDEQLSVVFASVQVPNSSRRNVTMLGGGAAFNTTNPPNNFSITFNDTSQTGAYTIRIVANDSDGNVNDTETSVFTIVPGGGGDGGGGVGVGGGKPPGKPRPVPPPVVPPPFAPPSQPSAPSAAAGPAGLAGPAAVPKSPVPTPTAEQPLALAPQQYATITTFILSLLCLTLAFHQFQITYRMGKNPAKVSAGQIRKWGTGKR